MCHWSVGPCSGGCRMSSIAQASAPPEGLAGRWNRCLMQLTVRRRGSDWDCHLTTTQHRPLLVQDSVDRRSVAAVPGRYLT